VDLVWGKVALKDLDPPCRSRRGSEGGVHRHRVLKAHQKKKKEEKRKQLVTQLFQDTETPHKRAGSPVRDHPQRL